MELNKELIYATRPFMKEDRVKSWSLSISTLILLVISISMIYIVDILPVQILFSLLSSLLLVRFFVMYHDFMHKTILTKSPVAHAIFAVFGLYVLTPPSIWKRSHNFHHENNAKLYSSSIGSYPIVTVEKFKKLNKKERAFYLFVRHPLTILFSYFFGFILGTCLSSFISKPTRHWDSLVALILHFTIATILIALLGFKLTFLAFLFPIMLSQTLGAYLFYAQHNFPGVTYEDREGWTFIKAALNSSSFMKMNPVMHWFTANIGYHHIHHLNAGIPFYNLPIVFHKFPELQNAKTTSWSPKDVIKCFTLKVWDPKTKSMVSAKSVYQAA